MLDLNFVRRQFPSLNGEWIYMDNAGGSQILKSVADNISKYLLNFNVQLGASYKISQTATEAVVEGAAMTAEFINAADQSEVIIGSSTTMLIRILSLCLGRTFRPGDEIIVTNCDHEANIGAWVDLHQQGIIIKWWKINPDTFKLELRDLKKLMTDKTKLVAATHTSNILGTLNPIKDWAEYVHDNNAFICIDGVAHAPHRAIDVQESGVDFYAFSFYKVYGPHLAMLYGKKELLLNIPGINHFFIGNEDIPYKFQPGSVNYELSYGIIGLRDYFNSFAAAHNFSGKSFRENVLFTYNLIAEHEEILAARLLDYLNSKSNVKIIGESTASKNVRVPTISFMVDNTNSDSITLKVDESKIGIRFGDFYARRLIDDLGLSERNGVVRVSMLHYNSLEEVDKLIAALDSII